MPETPAKPEPQAPNPAPEKDAEPPNPNKPAGPERHDEGQQQG